MAKMSGIPDAVRKASTCNSPPPSSANDASNIANQPAAASASPTDDELSHALAALTIRNPEFGVRRLATALRDSHPHWRFHERRLRRLAARAQPAPPPPPPDAPAEPSAAAAAAPPASAAAGGAPPVPAANSPASRSAAPLFAGRDCGSVPNIGWRAVPMEHLRLHPRFSPL